MPPRGLREGIIGKNPKWDGLSAPEFPPRRGCLLRAAGSSAAGSPAWCLKKCSRSSRLLSLVSGMYLAAKRMAPTPRTANTKNVLEMPTAASSWGSEADQEVDDPEHEDRCPCPCRAPSVGRSPRASARSPCDTALLDAEECHREQQHHIAAAGAFREDHREQANGQQRGCCAHLPGDEHPAAPRLIEGHPRRWPPRR